MSYFFYLDYLTNFTFDFFEDTVTEEIFEILSESKNCDFEVNGELKPFVFIS